MSLCLSLAACSLAPLERFTGGDDMLETDGGSASLEDGGVDSGSKTLDVIDASHDGAQSDASSTWSRFIYAPANGVDVLPDQLSVPAWMLDGDCTVDTSNLSISGCRLTDSPLWGRVSSGSEDVVLHVSMLSVSARSTLRVAGRGALIILVYGSAEIDGTIDVSASGPSSGPGAADGPCEGADAEVGGGGGGGGGHCIPGGDGAPGLSGEGATGGEGAPDSGLALQGGCRGGTGARVTGGRGGGGGGALQISAAARLTLRGHLLANGGGGEGGGLDSRFEPSGGGGGGSGGSVVLEASSLELGATATILSNGGGGGSGGGVYRSGYPGEDGSRSNAVRARGGATVEGDNSGGGGSGGAGVDPPTAGGRGEGGYTPVGGGGGGGSAGRILLHALGACEARPGVVYSPPPTIIGRSCP